MHLVWVRAESKVVQDTERGVEHLQCLNSILGICLLQLLFCNDGSCSREAVFLQFLESGNHHLIQLRGILFQIDGEIMLLSHGKLLRLIADVGYLEHISRRATCNDKLSVRIRGCTFRAVF